MGKDALILNTYPKTVPIPRTPELLDFDENPFFDTFDLF
jgi:hypothetical protein